MYSKVWWRLKNYRRLRRNTDWHSSFKVSLEALHTSAKARLPSVTIRIWIRIFDPDRHQNLIVCSLDIANLPWTFHANPFGSFCAKLRTDKQTNNDKNIISLAEIMITHYLWILCVLGLIRHNINTVLLRLLGLLLLLLYVNECMKRSHRVCCLQAASAVFLSCVSVWNY